MIPVGHHNLQRLSRVYVEECVIENCDEVLELFERYLTPVYFSGHLHTQKVMKHLTEPEWIQIHTEYGRSSAIP